MRRRIEWCLVCAALITAPPAQAQGIVSAGGAYAGAAGLGAGLSASMNHGRVVTRGYQAVVDAQRAALAQTKAIEQYMTVGCRFEAQKNWQNAEKSFTYVLQIIAKRDGPGSAKSVPALKHLVTVTTAQNKLDEAINFQKTVLAFSQQTKDAKSVNSAQIDLANLFIKKEDYVSAEPVCSQSAQTADTRIPVAQRTVALNVYAKVLRKLHKEKEAAAVEAEATAATAKQEAEANNLSESTAAKVARNDAASKTTAAQPDDASSQNSGSTAPQTDPSQTDARTSPTDPESQAGPPTAAESQSPTTSQSRPAQDQAGDNKTSNNYEHKQ